MLIDVAELAGLAAEGALYGTYIPLLHPQLRSTHTQSDPRSHPRIHPRIY